MQKLGELGEAALEEMPHYSYSLQLRLFRLPFHVLQELRVLKSREDEPQQTSERSRISIGAAMIQFFIQLGYLPLPSERATPCA
jgi:hypothetical protein